MENELIDFKAQENFNFFTYRNELSNVVKEKFLLECQTVLERAHATALDTLKLAVSLAKLKRGQGWKEVVNPEDGMTFIYSSFEKFSKYAFGFSKTRTSNLLGLSEFVELNEKTGELIYKHERYETMNMSQLIELAPLSESKREYFDSKMPVADIRLCKKYMDDGSFLTDRNSKDFDLLQNAKCWNETRQVREVVEEVEERLKTTTGTAFIGTEIVPTSEFLEEKKVISLNTRAKIREFLLEFEKWETVLIKDQFFDEVKRFRFTNGVAIYATTYKNCVDVEEQQERTLVFYFLCRFGKMIKISKSKLEIWLRVNEKELFGGV